MVQILSINLLFGLLLSSSGFAHEEKGPFAATPSQIRSANCALPSAPTSSEIWEWVERFSHSSPIIDSVDVHGVQLLGQKQRLIEVFRELLEPRDEFYSPLPSRQKRFPSVSCSDIRCAVDTLFGAETGPRIFYILARYGLNPSPIAFTHSAGWKTEELDDVILALSDFPEHLLASLERQPLILSRESDGDAIANRKIVLFPSWRRESREIRRYAVFHENAHRLGQLGNYDTSEEWQALSGGWTETYTRFTTISAFKGKPKKPERISSTYGETNPLEDFAEAMAQYRYAPEALKESNPEKFEALRLRFFDGMDYSRGKTLEHHSDTPATQNCRTETSPSENAAKDFIAEWNAIRADQGTARLALSACFKPLFESIATRSRRSDSSLSCVKEELYRLKLEAFLFKRAEHLGIPDSGSVFPTLVRHRLSLQPHGWSAFSDQERFNDLHSKALTSARTLLVDSMLLQAQELHSLGKLYERTKDGAIGRMDCRTFSSQSIALRIKESDEFRRVFLTPDAQSLATLDLRPRFQELFKRACEGLPAPRPETSLERFSRKSGLDRYLGRGQTPLLPSRHEFDQAIDF